MNIKAERPITDILGQLIDQVTRLIRNESALARAEIGDNVAKLTTNLSLFAAGVALLLPGVVVLLEAAVAALTRAGVNEPLASLLVGGLTLVLGIVCISVAIGRFKSVSLVPKHTIKQLQRDVAAVQEAGKHHDA